MLGSQYISQTLIFQEGNSGRIKEEEDRVVVVAIRWVHVAEDRCIEEDRITHVVECEVVVVEETSKEPHIIMTSSSQDLTEAGEAEPEEEEAITRISHGIRTSLLTTMHRTRHLWIVLTVVVMILTSGITVNREEGKRLLGRYTGHSNVEMQIRTSHQKLSAVASYPDALPFHLNSRLQNSRFCSQNQ